VKAVELHKNQTHTLSAEARQSSWQSKSKCPQKVQAFCWNTTQRCWTKYSI